MTDRKLPVGIQSFEDIRLNEYIYVDKTDYIWSLVKAGKVYFLSRPRRFGKSLLISTMEAYFRGKKELFRGLAIERYEESRRENAWQEYPVIRFSLSGGDYHSPEGLADRLGEIIRSCAEEYGLTGKYSVTGRTLPVRFSNLIYQLHEKTGRQAVVLVDEYDKPLLETMEINREQEERNRLLYKGFFGVLKDQDQYLKFVFFTGVTKFSKVSIFSDLNQLTDISFMDEMSGVCGISRKELEANFEPEIARMADARNISAEECRERLKERYDGYLFSENGIHVYNPFSLLSAFRMKKFGRYWFETGTPTFLIRKLQSSVFTPEDFTEGVEAKESDLKEYRVEDPNPIPLFYQSGYLTIKGYDEEFELYSLNFPNAEVRYGFLESLTCTVLGNKDAESPLSLKQMVLALRSGNVAGFMDRLEGLFAGIPYPEGTEPDYEREWRNQIYLILSLMGQNVRCEVHSSRGRADCIAETRDYVYVFEFKVDRSADEALAQIEEKGYVLPYKADSRTVYKVGANFSSEKRNILEWKMEK